MKTSVHSWTKKIQSTSQSQICTKKRSWSLVVCCPSTTAFWILTKPLHLQSLLNKSMKCTGNWNACILFHDSAWPPVAQPTLHRLNWAKKSCHICHIHLTPPANWLPLPEASQQLFAGKMLPRPAGSRKCFPRVCQIPKHRFLYYRNTQTYFSLAKMCWL